MPREAKTRYVLLGMLAIRPMSDDDMKQMIEKSFAHFWAESDGDIDPRLRELVAEGLVTHEEQHGGQSDRHQYTITEAGRQTLCRWLEQPAEPLRRRYEVLLKVFMGGDAPIEHAIAHIERFREQQLEELRYFSDMEHWLEQEFGDNPRCPYWLMTVRCGQWANRAMVHWCDESLADLYAMEEQTADKAGVTGAC